MAKKADGATTSTGGRKSGRDPAQTTRNKVKRIARSHKGHIEKPFRGPVADPKNHKYPSVEAQRFVDSLGITMRVSKSKGGGKK